MDAVLFDLFGTLVPQAPELSWPEQMRSLAEPLGMPAEEFGVGYRALTEDRMTGACTVEEAIRQICADAGVALDQTQVAAAVAARIEVLRQWLRPRPATLPALDRLRSAGVPIALVSDCSSDTTPLWPQTPMAPYFQTAVLSAEMGTRKPDPRMYLTACEALGVEPANCLYVGDGNSNELTGASAVGLRAVHLDAERPARPAPDYEGASWAGEQVTSLAEIPPLVGR